RGKINVAAARGESIPTGWLVDKEGKDTTDPRALANGGALLPFGADQAHKGYGLAFVVEVLSGLLTGIGFDHDPGGFSNDGAFVAGFAVDRFRLLQEFREEMSDFVTYLKDSPPAEGYNEILYPGEIEHRTEQQRLVDGIPIEVETWSSLAGLCERLGVTMPRV
ncbi:MAG: Ldh family oxidoreductase, partial [Acidimicrobiia bacterium]|nr:Ldh family oxidoreductase [Acidimicrobiia bacterium]